MKWMKAFVVSSVVGLGLLTGCGGTEAAEPAAEDSREITAQSTCTDFGFTPVSPGLTCSHFGFTFTHYKPDGSGCYLYRCSSGGSWSYKRINDNNNGCGTVEQNFCS